MELKYRTIDMTSHHSEDEVKIINQCFEYWAQAFQQDLQTRGVELNRSEFHRAKILAILKCDNRIAGFHLYSVFDLREAPSLSHAYLAGYPEETKNYLLQKGSKSLMAMEYLTVTPDFRSKQFDGVRAAEVLIRLGLRVLESLSLDAAVGVARVDRKVNAMGVSIGFEEVSNMEKYNNKCSLMYFDRHIHREIPSVQQNMIMRLWENRHEANKKTKVAA